MLVCRVLLCIKNVVQLTKDDVHRTLNKSSGRMPPKQIVRREPGDNSSSSSDSFDHLTRPVREHGLTSDSRMVWGSDPYSQSEPLPSVTPPKGRDDKDSR